MADAVDSVVNFVKQLPASALDLDRSDVPWLLRQLQDESLAERLSIKLVTTVLHGLGTPMLLRPSEFLHNLRAALAIVFELDDLVPVCFHTHRSTSPPVLLT